MAEWPEELFLEYSNVVRHWQDVDPEDIYSRDARPYVPTAKLEEVERERETLQEKVALKMDEADAEVLRAESQRESERADQLQAVLDALNQRSVVEVAVDAHRAHRDGGGLPVFAMDKAIQAALQAAKKQAGGGEQ